MAKSLMEDKEILEYRNLMQVPSQSQDGFTWTALFGALFIAIVMVPGAMYMQLLAGIGVGPAAQWVTVILFLEVARRAHKHLGKAEVFVLFYMAGAVMAQPFQGLLYNQFFAQSQAATGMGVAERLPIWFAPTDPEVLAQRSFFMWEWAPAIALVVFSTLMTRLNTTFLSYGLFRIASDMEKLPFPMAPIGAQGILALVEQQDEESGKSKGKDNWRWRVFSVGGILGLAFGAIYMGLPIISTAVFGKPVTIFPIPFVDWTTKTGSILPAVATGFSFDLSQLVVGMVLPFFAMVGSMIGFIITCVLNPVLYHAGVLSSWQLGDDTVRTMFKTNLDFYFSFSIGVAIALAVVGIWGAVRGFMQLRSKIKQHREEKRVGGAEPGANRGDIPASWVFGTYLFTSIAYILVCGYLIHWHPGVMTVLVFFAFVYTPLISYVTTRLEGMAGQVVAIPMVREASFILSQYRGGVDVWFLPVPMGDYGVHTVFYRKAELTGTRFWSIWKSEIVLVPIVLIAAIFFAQFIWSLGAIPSPEYPFAERIWELNAANQSIIYTSTLGRYSVFEEAFKPWALFSGVGFGLALFLGVGAAGLPAMMPYGIVRGLNQTLPHVIIPQFIGALIGRYYFQRRFGLTWRQYIPVVAAGFSCGMGLITVLAVGVNFLSRAVIKIPF